MAKETKGNVLRRRGGRTRNALMDRIAMLPRTAGRYAWFYFFWQRGGAHFDSSPSLLPLLDRFRFSSIFSLLQGLSLSLALYVVAVSLSFSVSRRNSSFRVFSSSLANQIYGPFFSFLWRCPDERGGVSLPSPSSP